MSEDYAAKAKELCIGCEMDDPQIDHGGLHKHRQIKAALIAADKAGRERTNKRWRDATVSTVEQWRGDRVDAVWLGEAIRSRAEKGGEG